MLDDFLFFRSSSPFFFFLLNFIVLFPYMFIIIAFWLGSDTPSGLIFFSCPPYRRLSSYLLHLFLNLISFLLFPCASVWVPIPDAILNGTDFFLYGKPLNNWKRSAVKPILLNYQYKCIFNHETRYTICPGPLCFESPACIFWWCTLSTQSKASIIMVLCNTNSASTPSLSSHRPRVHDKKGKAFT